MLQRFAFAAMGCPGELLLEADAVAAAAAFAAARAEIERLERRWSHYRADSLLGRLAAAAGSGEWLPLEAEDERLFALADALHAASAGVFDPSAGPLLALWDFRRASVPDATAIAAAQRLVGWPRVERRAGGIRLPQAGMRLDFGGLVKEYAADRAAQVCRGLGLTHGLVDLGGDITVIGAHRDGRPWRVGIRHPQSPQRALALYELDRGGLATSGSYARMFEVDGQRYSHLLDPRSGRPVDGYVSVSVVGPDCLAAGAVATVALLRGRADGAAWLEASGLSYLAVDAAAPLDAAAEYLSAAAL